MNITLRLVSKHSKVKTITKTHAIEFFLDYLQFFENLTRIMGKKQKGSKAEAKVAKSDPPKKKKLLKTPLKMKRRKRRRKNHRNLQKMSKKSKKLRTNLKK